MAKKLSAPGIVVNFRAIIMNLYQKPYRQEETNPDDKTPLTLGFVATKALTDRLPVKGGKADPQTGRMAEEQPSVETRCKRGELAEQIVKIIDGGLISYRNLRLRTPQINMLKDVIPRAWPNTMVVKRVMELLAGEIENPTLATVDELNPPERIEEEMEEEESDSEEEEDEDEDDVEALPSDDTEEEPEDGVEETEEGVEEVPEAESEED